MINPRAQRWGGQSLYTTLGALTSVRICKVRVGLEPAARMLPTVSDMILKCLDTRARYGLGYSGSFLILKPWVTR